MLEVSEVFQPLCDDLVFHCRMLFVCDVSNDF